MTDLVDEQDIVANQPLVIDNGSGVLKAGFAGDDLPKCVFPSYVGRPKHTKVMAGAVDGDTFVGRKAEELRGILRLQYPMEHGVVRNWSDMERIWSHIYSSELKIHSEEHPVLLTEAPLNPRRNREKAAEIFFETFNVPALFISLQAVLSLYASGRTTGVVLDSGDGVTHAVPIYEGFTIPHAISRIDLAGRDVTDHLNTLLLKAGYSYHTSAEREVVKTIKEACFNPQKEEAAHAERSKAGGYSYKLPDGNTVEVGPERFRAPEILFRPDILGKEYDGVHECLVNSINKADLDVRKTLFSHVVLSGGSTLFPGFGDRLLNEVRKLAPKGIKIRISAPPERKYSTWIGGSILASLATFKKMWVTSEEFAEEGVNIIHKRCF
eukprot:tig00000319_g24138.t1